MMGSVGKYSLGTETWSQALKALTSKDLEDVKVSTEMSTGSQELL